MIIKTLASPILNESRMITIVVGFGACGIQSMLMFILLLKNVELFIAM